MSDESNSIYQLFNIKPEEVLKSKGLIPVTPNTDIQTGNSAQAIDQDADHIRNTLYDTLRVGTEALANLARVATESQAPYSYEVLALLMKNIADSSEKLLKLHKDRQAIAGASIVPNPNSHISINNAVLFNGTTAELLKIVRQNEDDIRTLQNDESED